VLPRGSFDLKIRSPTNSIGDVGIMLRVKIYLLSTSSDPDLCLFVMLSGSLPILKGNTEP